MITLIDKDFNPDDIMISKYDLVNLKITSLICKIVAFNTKKKTSIETKILFNLKKNKIVRCERKNNLIQTLAFTAKKSSI